MSRPVEVLIAGVALVISLPVWLITSILVRCSSRGPILHRAIRVGQDGQEFRLYKFRSMVEGSDRLGPAVTRADDVRITRVGRLLRRTKVDELPQLLNVLKGEMSLVGPRPEDPKYVALYSSSERAILRVRPGITSPASIMFRTEEQMLSRLGSELEVNYSQILHEKLAIDLLYLEGRSWRSDLRVLLDTATIIICGRTPHNARGAVQGDVAALSREPMAPSRDDADDHDSPRRSNGFRTSR